MSAHAVVWGYRKESMDGHVQFSEDFNSHCPLRALQPDEAEETAWAEAVNSHSCLSPPHTHHSPQGSSFTFMCSVKLIHMTDLMSIWTEKRWSGIPVWVYWGGGGGLLWTQGTQSYRLDPVRRKGEGKLSISISVFFWPRQYPLMSAPASPPRWKEPSETTSQRKLSFLQLSISGKALDVHIRRQLSGPCQPLLDAPWMSSSPTPI